MLFWGVITMNKVRNKNLTAVCAAEQDCSLRIFVTFAVLLLAGEAVSAEALTAASKPVSRDEKAEQILIIGEHLTDTPVSRLPLTVREIPQSISEISRDLMDAASMIDINDVMMHVPGVNVTLYDTQRPLYFARGFQITDFQVDSIPTYSGSTNQEYDVALYENVEIIRGANGLFSGAGAPSATVNMIRKRPGKELEGFISAAAGSWDMRRGVGDLSIPLNSSGSLRSRFVATWQDAASFRDRYSEKKTALLGIVEADVSSSTTLALGYQSQDNDPRGTIWGTVPIFAADGSLAKLPVSTSFAPDWTNWDRKTNTLFADVNHKFNDRWKLTAVVNRTEGEVSSLRVYADGFPDRETGAGLTLLAGVGETEDTRNGMDLYVTGSYRLFGRDHDVVLGANASEVESFTRLFSSVAGWSHAVPDAWNYDGSAPQPEYEATGAFRIAATEQYGIYGANRFRLTNALSTVLGVRVSSWETGTENFNIAGAYTDTSGTYEVSDEITPYAGIIYELSASASLYASYTDIFNPQSFKDKNNSLLKPVVGANMEIGAKGEFFDDQLTATVAMFKTEQDNYATRDMSQPENSLPDGSSAYIGVSGTESQGVEFNINGKLAGGWTINASYTYVDTQRHTDDKIWTNLPEHTAKLSTHYQLTGALSALVIGGGLNWQSETTGFGIPHPIEGEEGVTFKQDSYILADLYATWEFNSNLSTTLSATNVFDKTYWANIDYANYGEPRNLLLSLKWQY